MRFVNRSLVMFLEKVHIHATTLLGYDPTSQKSLDNSVNSQGLLPR